MIAVTATDASLAAMNRQLPPDKQRIARNFSKGRFTYDQQAQIQRKIVDRLLATVKAIPQTGHANTLEIGCGTGNLTERLLDEFEIDRLYLNDLVPEFHAEVKARLQNRKKGCDSIPDIMPYFGDIESLPLPPELDLVISASTFQWLSDLDGLLQRIHSALRPSGCLAFSTFAPGTLVEFRELTGIGLEYERVETIRVLLEPHFNILKVETITDRLLFSSPRQVLRHLQATGVCGVGGRSWTPQRLRRFEAQYIERFGDSAGVPVTYVASCFLALPKRS